MSNNTTTASGLETKQFHSHDNILPLLPDLSVEELVPEIDDITVEDINTIIKLLEKPSKSGFEKDSCPVQHEEGTSVSDTDSIIKSVPILMNKSDVVVDHNYVKLNTNCTPAHSDKEDPKGIQPSVDKRTVHGESLLNNLDVLTEVCEHAECLKTDSSEVTLTSATTNTCAPVASLGQAMFVNKPVCDGNLTAGNTNEILPNLPFSSRVIPPDTDGPVAIHNPHEHPVVMLLPQHLAAYQPVVDNDTMNQLAFKNDAKKDRCDTCYPPVLQYEFLGDDYSTC